MESPYFDLVSKFQEFFSAEVWKYQDHVNLTLTFSFPKKAMSLILCLPQNLLNQSG